MTPVTPTSAAPGSRAVRHTVLAIAAALPVLGFATTAFTAALAAKRPLLLIALEAPIRNLLLAHDVPLVPYLVVATVRKTASAVIYFYVGRWYGNEAVRRVERRASGAGNVIRAAEYGMRKASWPTVFLFPIPLVGVLAGSIAMRPSVFVALTAAGALVTAIAARVAGAALQRPIGAVLRFFDENLLVATAAIALLVVVASLWRWRRTRARVERAAEQERAEEGRFSR
jgi:membrane protein DedA with SNARE-associated domain